MIRVLCEWRPSLDARLAVDCASHRLESLTLVVERRIRLEGIWPSWRLDAVQLGFGNLLPFDRGERELFLVQRLDFILLQQPLPILICKEVVLMEGIRWYFPVDFEVFGIVPANFHAVWSSIGGCLTFLPRHRTLNR